MLIQVLKMRFPSVFGLPRQHFTIDNLREIKSILKEPPYHICYTNKTLTCTFDVSTDLNHEKFNLDDHIKIKTLEQELFEIKKLSNSIDETNRHQNNIFD
jgi:hypothetical protein